MRARNRGDACTTRDHTTDTTSVEIRDRSRDCCTCTSKIAISVNRRELLNFETWSISISFWWAAPLMFSSLKQTLLLTLTRRLHRLDLSLTNIFLHLLFARVLLGCISSRLPPRPRRRSSSLRSSASCPYFFHVHQPTHFILLQPTSRFGFHT